MALVPATFALLYSKVPSGLPSRPVHADVLQAFQDLRSLSAVLFALTLLFQFGNEWSIAGWLPLFLIRRVGLNPASALLVLAWYWLCLLLGRVVAVALLSRVRHGRILACSVGAAFLGCLILFFTDNAFGASTGACFVGIGFASIYPLVAEQIGRRFRHYHPGFFNSIFSLASLGGCVAPAALGYAAEAYGIGVVMAVPLLGTCMVVALLLLIWLESRITGG
jgi:fucose permease